VSTVIVTGGASGLGAAVCELLGDGAVSLDLRPPAGNLDHEIADLADRGSAAAAVDGIASRRGGLDGVVAAAGIDHPGPLAATDPADWERVIAVNLLGMASVVRAALPHLERSHGRVVTVASTLGLRGVPDATAYCASKFGVVGFSRALAAETAGRVGVTLLIPGGMRTAFFDGRDPQYQPTPDASLNDPADVARAVIFALQQPAGCELRELVIAPATEPSWP
jgi:NAD(P)-dependent dehydrogenase (short-subunit alcohol dehydrogenase family)